MFSVTQEGDKKYKIQTDATDVALLRRALMEDVISNAVDRVKIRSNTSNYCDEVLSHRLGLVPLLPEIEDAIFLRADGPAIVLASSLRDEKGNKVVDDEHEDIVLLLLKEGQRVDFTCEIIRGSGRDNVKFSKIVAPFINRSGDLVFETISKQYLGEKIAREALSFVLYDSTLTAPSAMSD